MPSNALAKVLPQVTAVICTATLLYSTYVAFDVTGNPLGTVKIPLLEPDGGVTSAHLGRLELWRLLSAQLIHAKQLHMLYNVLALALLGLFLERRVGSLKFFLLWLVSGSIGTVLGTLFVPAPWNLGTGASQAALGIAGFGLVLHSSGLTASKRFATVLWLTILPAFALDFVYAGYAKPGHAAAFLIGAVAGLLHSKRVGEESDNAPIGGAQS